MSKLKLILTIVLKQYVVAFSLFFSLGFGFSQTESSVPSTALESDLDKDVNLDGDKLDTVYLISTLSELLWITENVRDNNAWSQQKIFLQTEDIDATETKFWDDSDDDADGNKYNDPNDSNTNGNNEGEKIIPFEKNEGEKAYRIPAKHYYQSLSSNGKSSWFQNHTRE